MPKEVSAGSSALAGIAWCQTTSGSIAGTVLDAQAAAIPGANVTALETLQKFTFTATTIESGMFVFTQVPPGTYTIKVEAAGFKMLERPALVVNANDKIDVGDLKMEVGLATEAIEVSASAVLLQTESAERSSALVAKQMQNIAVNSRSYLDLVKLVPGVVSTINLQTASMSGLGNISANGTRLNSNQLMINGISNADTGSNGSQNVTLSLDSVDEFKDPHGRVPGGIRPGDGRADIGGDQERHLRAARQRILVPPQRGHERQ